MRAFSWYYQASLLVIVVWFGGCAASSSAPDYSAALKNPDRPQAEVELDATRKPQEVLAFSAVVGPQGIVYTVNPNSRDEINQRWKSPKYANVKIADGPFDQLALPQDGSLDLVLIHLNYHDVVPETRAPMNKRIYAALKRGGTYAIVDHSAKDGTGNEANKTLHRIDKAQVIKEVSQAGFKLENEGNMLRKPQDTRDFNVNKERNKDDRFVLAFQKP